MALLSQSSRVLLRGIHAVAKTFFEVAGVEGDVVRAHPIAMCLLYETMRVIVNEMVNETVDEMVDKTVDKIVDETETLISESLLYYLCREQM